MNKTEKETIINFNEGDNTATIYTYNGEIKRRLMRYAIDYPRDCKFMRKDETGAVTYELDKRRLSIKFLRPLSEDERERRRKCGQSNANNLKTS